MSKLVTIGALVAALSASASAAGHGVRAHHDLNSCSFISPQRSGGISEMASCGRSGVRGNRAEFMRAITRPVGNRPFLSQLAH